MKRKILLLLLTICLIGSPFFIQKANAVDVGIGFASYYMWWEPAFRSEYDKVDLEPFLILGPALSISHAGFTLSGLAIVTSDNKTEFYQNFNGSNGPGIVKLNGKYQRADLDIVLTYSIFKHLSVFTGFKYLLYSMEFSTPAVVSGSYVITNNPKVNYSSTEVDVFGGGLGLSTPIALTDALGVVPSLSILYSESKLSIARIGEESAGVLTMQTANGDGKCIGYNITLNLTYYFQSINTALTFGGRWQYLKYYNESTNLKLTNDSFYGITFSTIYYF